MATIDDMRIDRIVSDGLAHFSYVCADGRDAAVIDPRRDVDVYLELARREGLTIRWVLETHRNEDYVIGSTELARATGARIVHGRGLSWGYGEEVGEGDELDVGSLLLRVLPTPGHTREHLAYVLHEARGAPPLAVFTGDALFAGDVGRVDLYGPAHAEANARALFESLHARLLPLGDGVIVHPAHGGGSVCGGAIADRPVTTLGYERANSPILALDEAAFVRRKLAERHVAPPYFARMERWNLEGAPPLPRLPATPALGPDDLERARADGALLVDLRQPEAFAGGHVPGSLSVWLAGLPAYGGWFLPEDRDKVLIAADPTDVETAVRHLVRIGVERVIGACTFASWRASGRPIGRFGTLDWESFDRRRAAGWQPTLVDARKPDEHAEGVLPGARLMFAGEVPARAGELPPERPVVVHCSVGNRASIAASVLAARGLEVWNLLGVLEGVDPPLVAPDATALDAETRRLGAKNPSEGEMDEANDRRVDDRFTVGGQPSEDKLKALAEQGFRSVVNFRTEGESDQPLSPREEGERVRALGLAYLHVPVDVQDLREEQVDRFLRDVAQLPGPVYAHCRTGMRSGAFVMIKKALEQGKSGDELLRDAEARGFPCDDPRVKAFVKGYVDARVPAEV